MNNIFYEVVVIGGGPAGMAAALGAVSAGAERVLIIEREAELGGILQQCIHNGFGLHRFGEELTGPQYAARFIREVQQNPHIDIMLDTTVLEVTAERELWLTSPDNGITRVQAGAVVLAMGCRERTRGAIGITGHRPAGVFTAGTAQRLVNREGYLPGKKVVILGSGDIGLIMARRLTLEGAEVKAVLEVMPYSNGLTRNIVQCLDDFAIPLYLSHTITKVHGRDRVSSVTCAAVDEKLQPIPGTDFDVECDCLLLSVGLIPENELSRGCNIPLDPKTNGPVVDQSRQTLVPGFFAAGNVLHVHDLVDWVSEEGDIAGRSAAAYAIGKNRGDADWSRVEPGSGVRVVVPQRINRIICQTEGLEIYCRASAIERDIHFIVSAGDRELYRRRLPIVKPSEMVAVKVPAGSFAALGNDPLTVSITPC